MDYKTYLSSVNNWFVFWNHASLTFFWFRSSNLQSTPPLKASRFQSPQDVGVKTSSTGLRSTRVKLATAVNSRKVSAGYVTNVPIGWLEANRCTDTPSIGWPTRSSPSVSQVSSDTYASLRQRGVNSARRRFAVRLFYGSLTWRHTRQINSNATYSDTVALARERGQSSSAFHRHPLLLLKSAERALRRRVGRSGRRYVRSF